MADDLSWSDFTGGEKVRLVALHARMAKRGIADNGTGNVYTEDLKRKVKRIEKDALRRKNGK